MKFTRPAWPVAFDLIAYGAIFLAILAAAALHRLLGS